MNAAFVVINCLVWSLDDADGITCQWQHENIKLGGVLAQECSECVNGLCEDDTCWCYAGYTGVDCSSQVCGEGVCDSSYTCVNGNQCCSALECTYPLEAEGAAGLVRDLPVAAFVGLGAIAVMVVGLVLAVLFIRRNSASTTVAGGSSEAKKADPDKLSGFVPAADVTSADYAHDVTGSWERTDSNAKVEDVDYVLPYVPTTIESETVAWESPDETSKVLNEEKRSSMSKIKSKTEHANKDKAEIENQKPPEVKKSKTGKDGKGGGKKKKK